MPPEENNDYEMYLMNENGDAVKIERFSEMSKCEVGVNPCIDLKSLYEAKYEANFVLTPESEAVLRKMQEQLDAEIVENLQNQIQSVDAVIQGLKSCDIDSGCSDKCPYYEENSSKCYGRLYKDAIAIAEAYKSVVKKGLKMMEERKIDR